MEAAERVRKERKKAIDIYAVNANSVPLGRDEWAVEIYMGAAGAELIEGFKTPYDADTWIRENAEAYVVKKGLPKGTRVIKRLGYPTPPVAVTLDIDDTVELVHGHQQLSLFNAHYDERCFLPIHVYDTAASRPVAVLLRPGKTPSGKEVAGHLRRLVRRIRRHWPTTKITLRGDGHYGRPEVMDFCENVGIDFVFRLPGNATLDRAVEIAADDIRTHRALQQAPVLRG